MSALSIPEMPSPDALRLEVALWLSLIAVAFAPPDQPSPTGLIFDGREIAFADLLPRRGMQVVAIPVTHVCSSLNGDDQCP